jgi:hypothetical protein
MDGMNPAAITPYTDRVIRPVGRAALRVVATRGVWRIAITGALALEARVDLCRVVNGEIERIEGVDADVYADHWQTIELEMEGDRFAVSLDGKLLFTAWDRTFPGDGQVALRTDEDNTTRFDQIKINQLPWSEEH